MWGERTLDTVTSPDGQRRVRFCQRPDTLFTYYVEELRGGTPPARFARRQMYWGLLRDGGLFGDEAAMQRDARVGADWIGR